ncbi:DUF2497 domain-containing protein [Caldovatus aquaticus]|uniref:DUF2497 domain-containing protein n=1 Tax=Caldovatus aquaticus TaxID=2865671 RepID=A0ABS7F1G3_9PROT|nr:DUF2497 domain-containing protein [Caldovatus aquaticus]MBW8269456.1 DUF2497 domain-containing protein [Caldovatus aquaticus]
MEEILASIRRILNEDETVAGAAAASAAGEPPPPTGDAPEPLALTEDMLVEAPRPAAGGGLPAPAAAPAAAPEDQPAMPDTPRPDSPPAAPPSPPAADAPGLVAPATAAAAAAAVGSLLRAVAAERTAAVARGGPTLEDVVREEIRPLLKEWLDRHLPPLVERLVRAEIERVVGRALS